MVQIIDTGTDNQISIAPGMTGVIRLSGSGNRVSVAEGSYGHLCIDIGHRGELVIGPDGRFPHLVAWLGDDCRLSIGANLRCTSEVNLRLHEPSAIAIGDDCMFGPDVQMLTSDMHPVYDRATGIRVNPAADIVIGDHVWLAMQTLVLKGSRIDDGAIVGARGLVAGHVPGHCAMAGGRIVRENVSWHSHLPPPDAPADREAGRTSRPVQPLAPPLRLVARP